MGRIRINIFANLVGSVWSTAMTLLFVPIYVRLIGIDGYGLVGLYVSLQNILQVLDLGLSPVMNREMARYSTQPERAAEARDFVRTVEVGYWFIGLGIAVVLVALSPVLATQWIRSDRLSDSVITQAIVCMAVMSALQWPMSFYGGGLLGLQRQVLLNGLNIAISILSNVGAVVVLVYISPTIITFFQWQIFVSAVRIVLYTIFLWRSLPPANRSPKMRPSLVRNIWHFAASMSVLSLTSVILSQSDKFIISRVLGLEAVGYYTLAGVIASGVTIAVSPVYNALFPRFSALVAVGAVDNLRQLYHQGAQIMAAFVMPIALVLATFSASILLVWTGDAETARIVAPTASLLVLGMSMNGIMHPTAALQLAHGTTRVNVLINCVAIVVLIPLSFPLVTTYGMIGATPIWVLLNLAYVVVLVPMMLHRFLPGQTRRWFLVDVGLPTLGALVAVAIARQFLPLADARWALAAQMLLVGTVAFAASVLMTQSARAWLQARITPLWHQLARP